MEVKIVSCDSSEYRDAVFVRRRVFMDEQNVPEDLELDEFEETATHFVAYNEGEVVGAGRCRNVEGNCKVERICVMPSSRKHGVGQAIMRTIEGFAYDQHMPTLILHAQTHAERFYKRLGYATCSDEVFLDAGIPHVSMKKRISSDTNCR